MGNLCGELDREAERDRMVRLQIERRGVRDPLVLAAMRAVPRHEFVPPEEWDQAYGDHALPLSHGQTVSQPYIVARMTEMLGLRGGERVLEIGTGSGYQTAVLAEIAGEVYSVEVRPELADRARARLGGRGVHVRCGDGRAGWPEHAPYDAILVTAAPASIPPALVEQLAEGGRLVIPVGVGDQELVLIEKRDGRVVRRRGEGVRFVPLVGEEPEA